MTSKTFGPLTTEEIEEIASEADLSFEVVAKEAVSLDGRWKWDVCDDVSIFVEILVRDLTEE